MGFVIWKKCATGPPPSAHPTPLKKRHCLQVRGCVWGKGGAWSTQSLYVESLAKMQLAMSWPDKTAPLRPEKPDINCFN